MPFQQIEKNLTHPTNWKLKVNYPYPSVQVDGCPSKQYDRVVSYWFRRGDEQFDKLGRVENEQFQFQTRRADPPRYGSCGSK